MGCVAYDFRGYQSLILKNIGKCSICGGYRLLRLGKETLSLEREFNRAAVFIPVDDRLPEWMTIEPLPPHNSVLDITGEDLDGVFNW